MKRRDFIRNCALASAAVAAPWAMGSETQETGMSFLDYLRHMEPNLVEGWHHKAISDAVAQHKKLIVCGPPMMGKSMLFGRYLLSYYLGNNPSHDAIVVTSCRNAAELREREFEATIDSERHKEIFPIQPTGHVLFGGLSRVFLCDADLMIFDDAEFTGRPYYKERCIYLLRHLKAGGRLCVTGSRSSKDDLYGLFIKHGDMEVLNIPAASNKGRVWPYNDSRGLHWMRGLPYDKVMAQYYQSP